MAPIGEAYFPPLDKCLSGAQLLWSWELCYNVLSRPDKLELGSLQKFLSDDHTRDLLLRSLSPYPPSSQETKSDFETKTSAINAAHPSHARYNIQEIRDDALWLSQVSKIDEVAALRITIIEYQNRPTLELSHTGREASLGHAFTKNFLSNNDSFAWQDSLNTKANGNDSDAAAKRKRSLVEILLAEKSYLLNCAQYIVARRLCELENETYWAANDEHRWLSGLADHLLSNWAPKDKSNGKERFLSKAIEGVESRLQSIDSGSQWSGLGSEQEEEQADIQSGIGQVIEIVHILEITLDIVQFRPTPGQAELILSWFRLMAQTAFFEDFQLPYAGLESAYKFPIQSLTSLISLTMLNVESTNELLAHASTATGPLNPTSKLPFLFDVVAVKELNDIFLNTASLPTASPCVMAWGIICQTMRNLSLSSKDAREARNEMRALDKYAGDSSDTDLERPHTRNMSAIRRRSSTGSDSSQSMTLVEEIFESIESSIITMDEDPIQFLAGNAVENGRLFDVVTSIAEKYSPQYRHEHHGLLDRQTRKSLLPLLKACVHFVDYQPAFISAVRAVVVGKESYWDIVDNPVLLSAAGPGSLLLQDLELENGTIGQALRRFPYESWPLLQLGKALVPHDQSHSSRSKILQLLPEFTCVLPINYQGYQNIREDEALDFIELIDDYAINLSVTPSQSANGGMIDWRRMQDTHPAQFGFNLPAGTQGQVLSDGKPLVVAWTYPFAGVGFIGRLLGYASRARLTNGDPNSPVSSDVVAEAIGFLTVLLISTVERSCRDKGQATPLEAAMPILDEASNEVERNEDIVVIIFRIFENELYKERKRGDEDDNISILTECVKFTHALLAIMPDRVWPFLGRSGLLATGDDGGRLSAVVASYEIITGQYDFLFGCMRLYGALIEDIITNAASRKRPSQAITRFGDEQTFGAGVSHTVMERVLSSFQRVMIDVFESFANWKYTDHDDQADIAFELCSVFAKLLQYAFGSHTGSYSKLNECLLHGTRNLLEIFLAGGKADLIFGSLIRICAEGAQRPSASVPTRGDATRTKQTEAALQLIYTLVQTGEILERDLSRLQTQLFKSLGIFASLYGATPEHRLSVIKVLDALVQASLKGDQQPLSLLAHLGQHKSSKLLESFVNLDRPVSDDQVVQGTWNLLSSILAMRQEWFAHYIMMGKAPSRTSAQEANGTNAQKAGSLFSVALDRLSSIDDLELGKAGSMLHFVSTAIDVWPQVLRVVNDHPKFMMSICRHASSPRLNIGGRPPSTSEEVDQIRVVKLIVRVLAIYTHWDLHEGKNKFSEEILRHIHAISSNVAITPNYNGSLHGNLRKNFQSRFPGCQVEDFRNSKLRWVSFQDQPYYDIGLADKMLSFEPAWLGKAPNGRGFADEMIRANLNLSAVEAQVELFQSWSSLLLELSGPLRKQPKFQKLVADNVVDCLKANANNNLPDTFSQRLVAPRAGLAFALLETLSMVKSQEPEVQAILGVAWNTLRAHNGDMAAALSSGDADYHRLLIRILYLAVLLHTFHEPTSQPTEPTSTSSNSLINSKPLPTSPSITIALEIISSLISEGFCSLTSLLLDTPSSVSPSDFTILNALLNTCLQVPYVSRNTQHLMNAFTSTATPRCAASLLSWSDQLAPSTNGDPGYGEIAMHFLVELSTVDAIAESLAVDAVLSHILATNLMQAMQDRAFGPWDSPPGMFTVWARGMLPLLLNLLLGVGAPVAPEVAAALNLFPKQLEQASLAFGIPPSRAKGASNQGLITLGLAQEAHCLAMIIGILEKFREAGASAGVQPEDVQLIKWDFERVGDDIEGALQRKGGLRDRIAPTSEKEMGWSRMKARREGMDSLLEEKIVGELRNTLGILRAREG